MQYREYSSIDKRHTVFYQIDLENPRLWQLHREAITKRCYFDHAFNRVVTANICEGGVYYPQGFVIFDMDSLAIWSVKNLLEVAKFIAAR